MKKGWTLALLIGVLAVAACAQAQIIVDTIRPYLGSPNTFWSGRDELYHHQTNNYDTYYKYDPTIEGKMLRGTNGDYHVVRGWCKFDFTGHGHPGYYAIGCTLVFRIYPAFPNTGLTVRELDNVYDPVTASADVWFAAMLGHAVRTLTVSPPMSPTRWVKVPVTTAVLNHANWAALSWLLTDEQIPPPYNTNELTDVVGTEGHRDQCPMLIAVYQWIPN